MKSIVSDCFEGSGFAYVKKTKAGVKVEVGELGGGVDASTKKRVGNR